MTGSFVTARQKNKEKTSLLPTAAKVESKGGPGNLRSKETTATRQQQSGAGRQQNGAGRQQSGAGRQQSGASRQQSEQQRVVGRQQYGEAAVRVVRMPVMNEEHAGNLVIYFKAYRTSKYSEFSTFSHILFDI